MSKKRLPVPKKVCFFCYYFTLGEFTEEDIKRCAEHWLDAENCSNWKPANIFIEKRRSFKKIIWEEVKQN